MYLVLGAYLATCALAAVADRTPGLRARPRVLQVLWWLSPLVASYLAGLAITEIVQLRAAVPLRRSDLWLARSSAVLPVLPVALAWGRYRLVMAGAVGSLLGLLALTDVLTLRGLDTLPSLVTMTGVGRIWSVRHSIVELFQPLDLLTLALPLGGVLLLYAASRSRALARARQRAHAPMRARWRAVYAAVQIATLVACALALVPLREKTAEFMDSRFSWKVFRVTDWVRGGVLTAHTWDTLRSLREIYGADGLSAQERDEVIAYFRARARTPSHREDFGVARGANLLVIQVEGMQQWVVGARYRGQPVTPFLDSLVRKRAVYFENIFDQTGPAATTNCEYAVLVSQQPLAVGATAFRRPGNRFVSLPKVLKRHGYRTYSAHAFHRGYWNRAVFHPQLGIDASHFADELGDGERFGWGLSDEAFLRRALAHLASQEQPLFGFLVTLTSHHPYRDIPRSRHRLRHVKGLGALGGYLHSMRYVDEVLAGFFAELEKSPLADNTLIFIYGDHESRLRFSGAQLRRARSAMRNRKQELTLAGKRDWVTDRIPVFAVLPGDHGARRIATVGGQVDLAPTMLHYLGIERPAAFLGKPLLPDRPGFVARMDGSAATRGAAWYSRGDGRCTDLRGSRLPGPRCEGLPDRAQRQLSMSWAVTLNDLYQELQEAIP